MGVFLYIILIAVVIVLDYYIAKQFETVAADKGYADSKYFHLCFWLGIVGYLLVIALPDRGNSKQSQQTNRTESNNISHMAPDSVEELEENAPIIWHPVAETNAVEIGETNIKCSNCRKIQFKGNKSCTQCGATFVSIYKK